MAKTIAIIDYGIGNLSSVVRAFQRLGQDVMLISTPEEVEAAEYVVLPGVGAFEDGMKGLKDRNLADALRAYVKSGRPLLGICLGMQLFMSESYEFGTHKGLDIIPGKVISLKPAEEVKIPGYKVPQIGWNEVNQIFHFIIFVISKFYKIEGFCTRIIII